MVIKRKNIPKDLIIIFTSAFLRTVAFSSTSIVLAIYLSKLNMSKTEIGILLSAGLAALAIATLLVSLYTEKIGRKTMLFLLSASLIVGGAIIAFAQSFIILALGLFIGMFNAMGRDRGAISTIEQSIIPQLVSAEKRTYTFSFYNVIQDAGSVVGALLVSSLLFVRIMFGVDELGSYRLLFVFYAFAGLILLFLYSRLSSQTMISDVERIEISPQTKKITYKFSTISFIDSFGGGFVTSALLAYWFFERFKVDTVTIGLLFSIARIANILSYFGAAWLAKRIGLINTMVFTHIPSSIFLIAVPFAPNLAIAVVLFILRDLLVEMDVPTRQSYVTAVVKPEERVFISGVTNFTRNAAWAVSPSFAGYAMSQLVFSAPLFIGGGLKIFYDVLLYLSFKKIRAPEEWKKL